MTPQQEWQKKVRRILLDPQGRAALKDFGIDVEIVQKAEDKDKPIVAVLCPTYRAPEPQMKDALTKMVQFTGPHATVYAGPPIQASVVHWSRNRLITEQLLSGKPWTHILFIDDDIVVEPDHLVKMLSHKKDIVAGLCTRRQDPPIPNMLYLSETTKKYERIWEWPENALIGENKKIAIGTGLMLISKHALEQVAQAYFDCLWEQDVWGLQGERLERIKKLRLQAFDEEKICYWFRFLGAGVEMGEDISFCHIATRYCDIPVYVDTSVQPGHLGNYDFGIKDFLPYRDMCIARAKEKGNYKPELDLGEVPKPAGPSFHLTYEEPVTA